MVCWYCHGLNEACLVCSAEQTPESRTSAGQDGWVHPAPWESEQKRCAGTHEVVNLRLLTESEEFLRRRLWREAHDIVNRVVRSLENHDASWNEDRVMSMASGEREALCLAFAQRARCLLLKHDYDEAIGDCKRFSLLYSEIMKDGDSERLHHQERQILHFSPGRTFLGDIVTLRAALEIVVQCRRRVEEGFAPKLVVDHTAKALIGVGRLEFTSFPGLEVLQAHLHCTRAQAALELRNWVDARQDAEFALALDPNFLEAGYLRQAAIDEEW